LTRGIKERVKATKSLIKVAEVSDVVHVVMRMVSDEGVKGMYRFQYNLILKLSCMALGELVIRWCMSGLKQAHVGTHVSTHVGAHSGTYDCCRSCSSIVHMPYGRRMEKYFGLTIWLHRNGKRGANTM
jgi:hypothetical protein